MQIRSGNTRLQLTKNQLNTPRDTLVGPSVTGVFLIRPLLSFWKRNKRVHNPHSPTHCLSIDRLARVYSHQTRNRDQVLFVDLHVDEIDIHTQAHVVVRCYRHTHTDVPMGGENRKNVFLSFFPSFSFTDWIMMSRELRNEKIARFHTGIFFSGGFPSRYRWKAAEWEEDGTRERERERDADYGIVSLKRSSHPLQVESRPIVAS